MRCSCVCQSLCYTDSSVQVKLKAPLKSEDGQFICPMPIFQEQLCKAPRTAILMSCSRPRVSPVYNPFYWCPWWRNWERSVLYDQICMARESWLKESWLNGWENRNETDGWIFFLIDTIVLIEFACKLWSDVVTVFKPHHFVCWHRSFQVFEENIVRAK